MFEVTNHLLSSNDQSVVFTSRPAPGRSSVLNADTIVIHYDVTHDMESNTKAQFASGLYYHVACDGPETGNSLVRQYVPLNRMGSHCKGWNMRAIGLVFVNPGPLIEKSPGKFTDVYGKAWPARDAVPGTHTSPGRPKEWKHWASYPHSERDLALELVETFVKYRQDNGGAIVQVLGHDWVDPAKSDPGPAFDYVLSSIRAAFPKLYVPDPETKRTY